MIARPILFSGPMVRANLADLKWQTRRVIRPQPSEQLYQIGATAEWAPPDPRDRDVPDFRRAIVCPYGKAYDRLWVRETFARLWFNADDGWQTVYRADDNLDCIREAATGQWKPSIHMPRWATRTLLEVTSVRVERVQEISHEDAIAEGCYEAEGRSWGRLGFSQLWDQINAKRGYSWEVNPWVWVIGYTRIKEPIE